MIDTNSVWIIVISLLLICIFVFGYYFYIEISQKEKVIFDSLNNRIEELEKNIIMNNNYIDECSDIDIDSDYSSESEPESEPEPELELEQNSSINEINENEVNNKTENEVNESSEEQLDENVNLQSVFSDIKSLLGTDSVLENELCKHIIISGKRKGKECGKRVKTDGKCVTHI